MFDDFQRATKQDSKEEFLYHLWHIAASQDDEPAISYFNFAQNLWNFTWDTIPTQLQSVSALFRSPVYHGSKKNALIAQN